jgi:AraC-like DNA-binding protein
MAVQSKPEYNWRIAEMAAMAKLSEPRFTVLYREFFKVSPKQDLIQIRLEKAKYLLMNNAVTVQEVANMTGYDSVYHFIRQFKKVVGCSPGKYYSDLFSGKHNEKDQFFN